MKSLKEEAIENFVYKNYTETKKDKKEIINWHLKRCIGAKKGFVGVLKEGEGVLFINRKGNLFDSNEVNLL